MSGRPPSSFRLASKILRRMNVAGEAPISATYDDKRLYISIPLSSDKTIAPRLARQVLEKFGTDDTRIKVTADKEKISIPISLPLNRRSLKGKAAARPRVSLRVNCNPSLYDLLTEECPPNLKSLDVVLPSEASFPFVRTLASANTSPDASPYFHLKKFHFKLFSSTPLPNLESHLLIFLQNCPHLQVIYLFYGDPEEVIELPTTLQAPELPHLRSFTHESPNEVIPMGLFNRLDLPTDHEVAVTFTITDVSKKPWDRVFPVQIESSLSDFKIVKITVCPEFEGSTMVVVGATFLKFRRKWSFNVVVCPERYSLTAGIEKMLSFLKRCKSFETLHIETCMDGPGVQGVLERVNSIATWRRWRGARLQHVSLVVQDRETWLKKNRRAIEKLKKLVTVEIVDQVRLR